MSNKIEEILSSGKTVFFLLDSDALSSVLQKHEPSRYYTVEQLAEVTGLTKQTIWTKHSKNELPGISTGKKLLFDRAVIHELFLQKKLRKRSQKKGSES